MEKAQTGSHEKQSLTKHFQKQTILKTSVCSLGYQMTRDNLPAVEIASSTCMENARGQSLFE